MSHRGEREAWPRSSRFPSVTTTPQEIRFACATKLIARPRIPERRRFDVIDLVVAQRISPWNPMPSLQTASTAGRCRVSRDKHRMTPKRRLLSVVQWMSWSETPIDNSRGALQHDGMPVRGHASLLPGPNLNFCRRADIAKAVKSSSRSRMQSSFHLSVTNRGSVLL